MIENSSAGLVMLNDEVAVTVTGEEHHQAVLARYPVAPGGQRFVAVELGWCTVRSGKYRGQPAIEVRLDGQRVGELTHLMSQRYGPLFSQATSRGGRPGCAAVIQRGERKIEIVLRLPHAHAGVVPGAPKFGTFSAHRPVWIGVAVVLVLLIGALASTTGRDNAATAPTSGHQLSTSSSTAPAATTPTTTVQATTTQPTTTLPPPPPAATTKPPAPKTTTRTQPPPPPAEEPAAQCDPNYSGCVPIASDVDCLGGSGNGPAYVKGPIRVIGRDIYDLDRDGDGIACE